MNTRRKTRRAFQRYVNAGATVNGNEYNIAAVNTFVDEDVILGVQRRVITTADGRMLVRSTANVSIKRNAEVFWPQAFIPGRFQRSSLPEFTYCASYVTPGAL
jgi:hypothetical protein